MNRFDFSRERLLQAIGLQQRRSIAAIVLPSIGMFGVGLIAGAGLGLLFAPRKGSELREDLGTKLSDASHKVGDMASTIRRKITRTGRAMSDDLSAALDEVRDTANYGSNGVSVGR
jgi:hypothetical protein